MVRLGGSDTGGAGLKASQIRRACESSLRRLGVEWIDVYHVTATIRRPRCRRRGAPSTRWCERARCGPLGASRYGLTGCRRPSRSPSEPGWRASRWSSPSTTWCGGRRWRGPWPSSAWPVDWGVHLLCPRLRLPNRQVRRGPPPGCARLAGRALSGGPIRPGGARAGARRRGATVAQVALAWQLTRPEVATPIASATSGAQVRELVGAVSLRLDAEDLAALDGAGAGKQ